MPKIHELVAVHDDLKSQANKTRTELTATFTRKSHLFTKKIVTTSFLAEGQPSVTDVQSDIQTTLSKEIGWVSTFLAKVMDSGLRIDSANTVAKADLVVEEEDKDPVIIAKDVPATFLLQLEHHLAHIQELAVAIPTLDPAKGFTRDEAAGKGIWIAREVIKEKTQMQKKVLTLAQATDKFAAQVQVYDAQVPIGQIREQEWSAATTPAIKAEVLANIDTLMRAVKRARSRANSTDFDVTGVKLGQKVLDFIFKPLE